MNPTFVFFTSLIGLVVFSILLSAAFLRLGLAWAKVGGVTMKQAIAAALIIHVLSVLLTVGAFWTLSHDTALFDTATLAIGIVGLLMPFVVIKSYFRTAWWRSILAWLTMLLSDVGIYLICLLVVRPFIFEAFAVSANSMAPTLLGPHLVGKCEVCNGPAIGSPNPHEPRSDFPIEMICQDHLHTSLVENINRELKSADRILVAKFIEPKRWDVVAFRLPSQPDVIYVKRLVGLPGEQIEIKDGGVWADGKLLERPEEIREIKYLSELPHWHGELWGTANRPALLGPDEYFVLGDYSAASMDSRFWEQGAPDYSPYAVPKSYIHGVVTNIYWPVSRWRAL